jgi:hypothetical protein
MKSNKRGAKSCLEPYYEEIKLMVESGKSSSYIHKYITSKKVDITPRGIRKYINKNITYNPSNESNEEIREKVAEEFNLEDLPDTGIVWLKNKNISAQVRTKNLITFDKMMEDFREFAKGYAPTFTKLKRDKIKDPHCLIIDIADLHLGKYASEIEGGSYNVVKAKERALEGLQGVIHKANGYDIDKVLFVIGNDVLHTDNTTRSTTKGTPQDTEGNWYENYLEARNLYIDCVNTLVGIADVHIVHCPSNHDYMSGFMLADSIYCYYHNHPNITFDVSINHYKYFLYGSSLIGLTHGDGASFDKLPLLMAQEKPIMWSKSKFRYWYLHHLHHKQKKWTPAGKDFNSVTVEYIRSPSGTDSYHHKNGYVSPKAIEGKIHSKEFGQVASLTHYFL